MVHPSLLIDVAKERELLLERVARRPRAPLPERPAPTTVRQRVGWSLIRVGVHLAVSSHP